MDTGQPGRARLIPESHERLCRGLHPAETLNQGMQFIDAEIGAAVNAPIGGVREIILDENIGNGLKGGGRDRSGIQQCRFAVQPGGVDVYPVVVGPHEAEFEPVRIGRFHEALFNAPFEKGAIIEIVPVEDKRVYAVIGCCCDFLCHLDRVRLVGVSP